MAAKLHVVGPAPEVSRCTHIFTQFYYVFGFDTPVGRFCWNISCKTCQAVSFELNVEESELKCIITRCTEAMRQAYAPYSDFPVGAALLTADGTVFTGQFSNLMFHDCGGMWGQRPLFQVATSRTRPTRWQYARRRRPSWRPFLKVIASSRLLRSLGKWNSEPACCVYLWQCWFLFM